MKLVVLPAGDKLFPDLKAQSAGLRRFIGRVYNTEAGGWIPMPEPVEIDDIAEHRQALREGDLLPGDQDTAKLLNLPFSDKKQKLLT